MKKVLALGLGAAALAMVSVGAAPGTNPNTLTLAVFGDSPYLDPKFPLLPHAEFNATPAFIDTMNADRSVQEVVQVGDIHSGSEPCTGCLRLIDLQLLDGVREAADLYARRQRVE
jgi:hypothetical protein